MRSLLNKIVDYRKLATEARHRLLLVLSGEESATCELAEEILSVCKISEFVRLDNNSPEGISSQKSPLLGQDTATLMINAHRGFDPDLTGIATGTVRAAGLCILATPKLQVWPTFDDPQHKRLTVYPIQPQDVSGHYLQRLVRLVREETCLISDSQAVECRILVTATSNKATPAKLPTVDQENLIQVLNHAFRSLEPASVLITSHRGRGKSSALGIAAATMLCDKQVRAVLVTAPSRAAVSNLFSHAQYTFESRQASVAAREALRFISPDRLLIENPPCDLLIVDEAAALPLPMLDSILREYTRLVFSTTQFGYEGAGRGFALRFRQMLNATKNHWQEVNLTSPVRYADADPVERFFNSTLMLDAESSLTQFTELPTKSDFQLREYSSKQLLEDEDRLRDLFALLVEAHYQTKPLDLRHILDGPNLKLMSLEIHNQPVAALLLASEGQLVEPALQSQIVNGKRRPQGHLLPQTLAYQHMTAGFLPLKLARIVRIAVHPEYQQRGLGTLVLEKLEEKLSRLRFDGLGATFGATDELLDFWFKSGFLNLHLGFRQNASSASYSTLMLKPFSVRARALTQEASLRHCQVLATRLSEPERFSSGAKNSTDIRIQKPKSHACLARGTAAT